MYRTSLQKLIAVLFVLLVSYPFSQTIAADDGFPGRSVYPEVQTIEIDDLYAKMQNDQVVIVDARSEFEYQTLNILNAVNIPYAKKSFVEQLKELRNSTDKVIVFYCNGRTCYKSYKATMKALRYNIDNCYSFDAGVFEWANKYPNFASLLGESPVKESSIISKEEFNDHLLSVEEFEKQILNDNAKVYDVRDRAQRRGSSGLFMFRDKTVSLDNTKKIKRIITKAIRYDHILYFYDQKGKQVRWLQYLLNSEGLLNYYFMKGGAGAYIKMIRERQGL